MGNVVIGGLSTGLGLDVNPFDSDFQKKAKIAELVKEADLTNARNRAKYLQDAHDWITQGMLLRASGHPVPDFTIPIPLVVHVDPKTGDMTTGPDAVGDKPTLPALNNTGQASQGVQFTTLAGTPPDWAVQMMNGLSQMYALIQTLRAELKK